MTEAEAPAAEEIAALGEAVRIMDVLRSSQGCPWDREQTHASLAPYAIEEAYELAEAAEAGDRENLIEELGDVLLQVLFHARIGEESSLGEAFSIEDVANSFVTKMKRRHPHVFAGETVAGADEVRGRWAEIKKQEKHRESVTEGIPAALPALARAQKLLSRAQRAGIGQASADSAGGSAPDSAPDSLATDRGAIAVPAAAETNSTSAEIGRSLLAIVERAQAAGVDAEAALRSANRDLTAHIIEAENAARAASVPTQQP